MAVADTVSRRSPCSRGKAGAVIVSATNRVIATGYNGPPALMPGRSRYPDECAKWCRRASDGPADPMSYDDCPTIHAEANALMFCDRRDRLGGTIYLNFCPCYDCAKLIANSALERVVCRVLPEDSHRNPTRALDLLRDCKLEVVQWTLT